MIPPKKRRRRMIGRIGGDSWRSGTSMTRYVSPEAVRYVSSTVHVTQGSTACGTACRYITKVHWKITFTYRSGKPCRPRSPSCSLNDYMCQCLRPFWPQHWSLSSDPKSLQYKPDCVTKVMDCDTNFARTAVLTPRLKLGVHSLTANPQNKASRPSSKNAVVFQFDQDLLDCQASRTSSDLLCLTGFRVCPFSAALVVSRGGQAHCKIFHYRSLCLYLHG